MEIDVSLDILILSFIMFLLYLNETHIKKTLCEHKQLCLKEHFVLHLRIKRKCLMLLLSSLIISDLTHQEYLDNSKIKGVNVYIALP